MHITNTETEITEAELASFETQYGLNLPEDYRQHILSFNGGVPTESYFFADDEEFLISSFLPILHGNNTVNKLLDVLAEAPQRPLAPEYYPFADDTFGNMYCINQVDGKVYLWEHDMEGEPEALARSFTEFINALVEDEEEYEF